MRSIHFTLFVALLFPFLLFLSACTIIGGGVQVPTTTPIPTSIIPNMYVVPSQACKIGEQSMIRVESPQGDLVSWSPVSDSVAYISSTPGSSWNVGELDILTAPQFGTSVRLATQAAGELTWAPDGSGIAYLGLRRSDDLYTIGVAYPDGRTSRDLFPDEAARTDDYSSQKSIIEWINPSQLRVQVSCDLNCLQKLDINLLSGLTTPVGDPIERYWNMWAPFTYQPANGSESFKLAGNLNWSWDEKRIAYIDEKGNAWVIDVGSDTLYPLDIGQYGTAVETDWSHDNKYLSVQVDQNLMIFSFQCP